MSYLSRCYVYMQLVSQSIDELSLKRLQLSVSRVYLRLNETFNERLASGPSILTAVSTEKLSCRLLTVSPTSLFLTLLRGVQYYQLCLDCQSIGPYITGSRLNVHSCLNSLVKTFLVHCSDSNALPTRSNDL